MVCVPSAVSSDHCQSCVFHEKGKAKTWSAEISSLRLVLICHENCVMAVLIVRISLSHCASHRPLDYTSGLHYEIPYILILTVVYQTVPPGS
jgi:hypothetical protein